MVFLVITSCQIFGCIIAAQMWKYCNKEYEEDRFVAEEILKDIKYYSKRCLNYYAFMTQKMYFH